MINNIQAKKRNLFISFFFPLYPIKVFQNTASILILSILISLRIILQFFTIHIPILSFSISISWTPLMIIGWIYGPVFGIISGIITDTISFLIKPAVWFWMFAIQEPLVGFFAGVFGFIYRERKERNTNSKIDFWLLQAFLLVFFVITCIGLIYFNENFSYEGKLSNLEYFIVNNMKWIVIVSFSFFLIATELTIWIIMKKQKEKGRIVYWIICMTCFMSIFFSFFMGTISANEYYKYLHGRDSPNFVKYGIMFYLIPRTIKESFKAPVQMIFLLLIIPIANEATRQILKNTQLQWKNKAS